MINCLLPDSSSPPADSFLVPQWGGVAVFNHNGSRAVKHRVGPLMVDMESVMPLFVQHLKLLLGLPSVVSTAHILAQIMSVFTYLG